MTAITKTSLTYDASYLVQGDTADATDIIVAADGLLNNDRAGRMSVTAADLYLKNLDDALAAGSGMTKTVTNPGANETLTLAVDGTVIRTTGPQAIGAGLTITTPVIASFVNAQHNHQGVSGGGQLTLSALSASGAANGDAPLWNGSGWVPGPPGGAPPTSPVDVTLIVAGEALNERDFVYLSAAGWKKVDIDASPVAMGRWRGLVTTIGGIANGALGTVRLMGEVVGFSGLTPNAFVYASSTPGGYTQIQPTATLGGAQVVIVPIGLAVSTSRILLLGPSRVQYRKRATTPNNGTLLIEHHDDPFGEGRQPRAFISSSTYTSIQSYDATNQSANVPLKKSSAVTITPDNIGTNVSTLGHNGTAQIRWAQAIVVTNSGYLTAASFGLGASGGSPTGQITVTLRPDNAGSPSTTLLWTVAHTPTANTVNTVSMTGAPYVTPGTYWFTLQAATQSSGIYWGLQSSPTNLYGQPVKADQALAGTWTANSTPFMVMRCSLTITGNTTRVAQSFSHTASVSIARITLPLRWNGFANADQLSVALYSDSAGSPGTLLGTSANVPSSALSTSGAFANVNFDYASAVAITNGVTYWFGLLSSGSGSTSDYAEIEADVTAAAYANGLAKIEDASTWVLLNGDLVFDIQITGPTAYNEPCTIGRSSGGTRDIAVRYDSGTAGTNTATNTQARNVTGMTLDLTFIVEMD